MLPTEDKTNIAIMRSGNRLVFIKEPLDLNNGFQHIYITSDEEIKEGDWCYDPIIKKTFLLQSIIGIPNKVFKIIATSDRSLKIKIPLENRTGLHVTKKLPNVSQDFIKAFVESNGKEDWEVEYQERQQFESSDDYTYGCGIELKLDSNNCVIITKKEKLCKHCGNPL